MKDLKFEQKRSLSRLEAADQLTAIADALREGGDAELKLGAGTLSLRIPDSLRSEVEIEIGDGQIELEIEFKWPTASSRKAPARAVTGTATAARRKGVASKPSRKTAAKKTAAPGS
ncbi:amphi-Trp domain-containing protein [Streptomyces sp. NPDC101733]|uniref:amphi-Trp domain-containing protein n=1 Tax=unclassified Streptomyces TaxID=2593676 RepID=UPI00380626ED